MPIGSSPSQASATRISTWMGYCSDYHFAKLNYESESFDLKRLLKRGILSKSIRLLPFLIQICSFRKARGSVVDLSCRTNKANCTVCNRQKSSRISRCNEDVKSHVVPFPGGFNYRCSCSRVREISVLLIYQGLLDSLETRIRARK